MKIHCIYGLSYDSNIYVIVGKKITIIDCGTGFHQNYVEEKIKKIVDPLKIEQIILTHEHFDHCGGVREIHALSENKAKIFSHLLAVDKIEKGESNFAQMLGGTMPKMPVDIKLNDDDKIIIGDNEFIVIHTPGHTPGSICLYDKKGKNLFSGDTVFAYGSFGRYDFPEGNKTQLTQSIQKLVKLEIKNLYPGHESIVEGNAQKQIKQSYKNISCFFNYD